MNEQVEVSTTNKVVVIELLDKIVHECTESALEEAEQVPYRLNDILQCRDIYKSLALTSVLTHDHFCFILERVDALELWRESVSIEADDEDAELNALMKFEDKLATLLGFESPNKWMLEF